MKKTYETHEKRYEKEVSRLTDIAVQHTLMKQKTTNTSAHASGAMVSLVASLKKASDEIREISGKHEEQLSIERARSDGLKAGAVDLIDQVMNVEEVFRISRSKQKMALAEVWKLNA